MCARPRLDGAGFTLVEIMVASAIMLVLGLALATMLYNSNTQQTRLEERTKRAEKVQQAALDMRLRPIPSPT